MIKKILIVLFLIIVYFSNYSYATDEIISSQMDQLNISDFIKEGQKYTEKSFPDINIQNLLNSAIKGEIDNNTIINRILNLFGEELTNAISLIASILVVVIIHGILKAFSDNLENNGVSQIAYYVEYILIVTLIMSNFSKVITAINESISNLVGFASMLFPILLALMSASRKYSFRNSYTANYYICNSIYCKFYYTSCFTNNIYCGFYHINF